MVSNIVYWLTIAPRLHQLKALLPVASIHPTGSRYVCNPPVMNTDIDFVIYSQSSVAARLLKAGFNVTSLKEYAQVIDKSKFKCWRRGKVNLVVTHDKAFAEAFQTGTHISKRFNVKEKWHRIVIHGTLRGESWSFEYPNMDQRIVSLLEKFTGPNGNALHQAYRAQQGLVL